MCFSAGASFGAATLLSVVGVITIKKVTTSRQLPFAAIPLMFAIQQFSEGFVWLSITNSDYTAFGAPAMYVFLVFAQVVWPIGVPFSMFMLEKDAIRRKILLLLTGMGIVLGAYLSYCLIVYPVKAEINSFHIDYSLGFPMPLAGISGISYFILTVFPAFISGLKRMQLLGVMITISFIITKIFYTGYLVSVWCFFAALISAIILYLLIGMNEKVWRQRFHPGVGT